ncbi:MAG: hypothetical protein OXN16_02895, partial [Gammaproteobacteria bacterium]|nr:hypothetical protein [Gammaproteobacteria bacterium]
MKESMKSPNEATPATAGADVGQADDSQPALSSPSSPSTSLGSPLQPSPRIPEHALDPVSQWLDATRGAISHNTERALRSDLAIW